MTSTMHDANRGRKTILLSNLLKALAGGVACFFLGFFLSLFVTVPWARHQWPGDGQAVLGAFWPSGYAGIVLAIAGTIILLMGKE